MIREEDVKATIKRVWFADQRIYIETNEGQILSRPLEAFPRLLEATDKQRDAYEIGYFGDDLRWEEIDEDVHISSFFNAQEVQKNNPVARVFAQFPQLNISQVAQSIGIHKSLLSNYIYGFKTPSPERLQEIEDALHHIGEELQQVSLQA